MKVISHHCNRIAQVEEALRIGVDYIEVDVRTAPDGRLVLAHDADEVPGAALFQEALALMKNRCGLYLDAKAASSQALVHTIQTSGMMPRTVVYARYEQLVEMARLDARVQVMPEANNVEHLARCLRELRPKYIAFDRRDFTHEVVQAARAARVEIFVDRLGAEDTPEHWQHAVRMGATGIQTDRPAELITMLSSENA